MTTQKQFDAIFDTLYYGCVQPTDKADKIYAARSKSYWFHYRHVRPEFFEAAVMRYLANASDGPFFPALGELRALSSEIAAEAKEAADKAEIAKLAEEYPDAAVQAAENEALIAETAKALSARPEDK